MIDNTAEKDNEGQDPKTEPIGEKKAEESADESSDDPLRKISPTVEAGDKNEPEAGG